MHPLHMPVVARVTHALPAILAARLHVVLVVPAIRVLPPIHALPPTHVARLHVVHVTHVLLTSFALAWTAI